MFVDIAKIKIKAGNGGDGAVTFHREISRVRRSDGGDGGREISYSKLTITSRPRGLPATISPPPDGKRGDGGRERQNGENLVIRFLAER